MSRFNSLMKTIYLVAVFAFNTSNASPTPAENQLWTLRTTAAVDVGYPFASNIFKKFSYIVTSKSVNTNQLLVYFCSKPNQTKNIDFKKYCIEQPYVFSREELFQLISQKFQTSADSSKFNYGYLTFNTSKQSEKTSFDPNADFWIPFSSDTAVKIAEQKYIVSQKENNQLLAEFKKNTDGPNLPNPDYLRQNSTRIRKVKENIYSSEINLYFSKYGATSQDLIWQMLTGKLQADQTTSLPQVLLSQLDSNLQQVKDLYKVPKNKEVTDSGVVIDRTIPSKINLFDIIVEACLQYSQNQLKEGKYFGLYKAYNKNLDRFSVNTNVGKFAIVTAFPDALLKGENEDLYAFTGGDYESFKEHSKHLSAASMTNCKALGPNWREVYLNELQASWKEINKVAKTRSFPKAEAILAYDSLKNHDSVLLDFQFSFYDGKTQDVFSRSKNISFEYYVLPANLGGLSHVCLLPKK